MNFFARPAVAIFATLALLAGVSLTAFALSDNESSPGEAADPAPAGQGIAVGGPTPRAIPVDFDGGIGSTPPDAGGGVSGNPGTGRPSLPRIPIDPGIGNGKPPVDLPLDAPVTSGPVGPRIPIDPGIGNGQPPVGSKPVTDPNPPLEPGRMLQLAPIEDVDIVVRESFPPQYSLQVRAGLPGGCAKPGGFEVGSGGTTIKVAVFNSMPTGNVACTMIYGIYDVNIGLGSDFVSGQTYTIYVNDKVVHLTAQ